MQVKVSLNKVYIPSENVVARDIQGELIIVPIVSGVGGEEDDIFTLNGTGRAIWDKLDGTRTLKNIAWELAAEFEALEEKIAQDVLGLTQELIKRKMLIETKKD